MKAGATVAFDTTWIARDSVLGIRSAYRIRGSRIRGGGDAIPVALSEVVQAEQRKPSTAGTIGLVVGGVVVAAGIFVAAVALAVCADPDASC